MQQTVAAVTSTTNYMHLTCQTKNPADTEFLIEVCAKLGVSEEQEECTAGQVRDTDTGTGEQGFQISRHTASVVPEIYVELSF